METKKEQSADKETSSESVIKRGKEAIEADEKINKAGQDKTEVKKDEKKDAEQWRNEG
jgi:hypothetical protein